jgi:branched-chain amino acid transport system permease protein
MNKRHIAIAIGVAVLMWVLSLVFGRFGAYLVNAVAIAGIGALALNLLIGYCGQISFAQGALLGVGAYAAGNISNAGLGGLTAILGGGVVAAIISALIGIPALRLRGLYFAIATLAAQAILEYLFKIVDPLTNGVSGLVIKPTSIVGFPVTSDQSLVIPSLVVLIISWLVVSRLLRTDLGRAFLIVRESEIVAKGMGIDVAHTKMWAFLIAGFIAGMGGALAGFTNRLASPEAFTLDLSADYIAMIIIGGLGTWPGPLIGAAFVVLLPEAIERLGELAGISDILSALRELAFGLLIILFLIFEPRGLTALLSRLRPRAVHATSRAGLRPAEQGGQPQTGGSK